jgi:DNA-binding response OmpR family regulator
MKTYRLIVVEDDIIILKMISDWLAGRGYRVYSEPDPASAIELFRAETGKIDLALIDVHLHPKSGFALADTLEKEFHFSDVIFMTAFFWEEDTLNELLKRGKPFFEKPLKFEEEVLPFIEKYLQEKETSQ